MQPMTRNLMRIIQSSAQDDDKLLRSIEPGIAVHNSSARPTRLRQWVGLCFHGGEERPNESGAGKPRTCQTDRTITREAGRAGDGLRQSVSSFSL